VVPGIEDLVAGERTDALSIGELYGEVADTLASRFPRRRELWVRGEIQNLTEARSGHGYFELVDPDGRHDRNTPVLRVNCWSSKWVPIKRALSEEGVILEKGTVVTIRGRLDFYAPRGQVNFIAEEFDVSALLGRQAAKRAELLRRLASEGLLEANRVLAVPAVPLRVGLVASPGTEGWRDFIGQLTGSGFAFEVAAVATVVQGPRAGSAVARAVSALAGAERDVVVVVRGGGSKADLAAFDTEAVARAIATSTAPVWTGIGHTGDESVADLVANRALITPTDCGRELAQRVAHYWETSVVAPTGRIVGRALDVLADVSRRDATARGRLTATTRRLLDHQSERVAVQSSVVARQAPRSVELSTSLLAARTSRLTGLARDHVQSSAQRIEQWRRLLVAYDVDRQLERGYTLTVDGDGRILRRASGLEVGAVISTRFADGSVRSVIDRPATVEEQQEA